MGQNRIKRLIEKQIGMLKKIAEMHDKRSELWGKTLVSSQFQMGFCEGSAGQSRLSAQLCRIQVHFLESLINP